MTRELVIKPVEYTSQMINKQQIFNLIDDQIAAYILLRFFHRRSTGTS
jgi:hypothetical protein